MRQRETVHKLVEIVISKMKMLDTSFVEYVTQSADIYAEKCSAKY